MKISAKQLMMTAAVSGLLGGTTARLHATPSVNHTSTQTVKASVGNAAMPMVAHNDGDKDKHSCKGKNDCKGKGGCKSGDNGCKGKNDCKGKGGCATDGSKPPEVNS